MEKHESYQCCCCGDRFARCAVDVLYGTETEGGIELVYICDECKYIYAQLDDGFPPNTFQCRFCKEFFPRSRVSLLFPEEDSAGAYRYVYVCDRCWFDLHKK
jgi:hypothetical protein